jgi:hypothetical protein
MFQIPVLLLALVLSAPALWSAFVDGAMSPETALLRFLIAVPIAAAMIMLLRSIARSHQREQSSVALSADSTPPEAS